MLSGIQKRLDASATAVPTRRVIFGIGEMADLTRSFDWSATPVGPVESWPEALLITVNTMLSSRHPMFLWWGEDLIQFYNDGYRASIREDKHPDALGQRGPKCWPEIWPMIGPQIEAVMSRGEASWHENQLVPIQRNGRIEDVYWTYGYSPVRDSTGAIRGTLVVCTETTANVLAKLQLEQGRQRLADLFQQAPAFFAVLGGPDHIFEMLNQQYQDLIGPRDVLGKPVREALPEAEAQGFVERLNGVYRTGVRYVGYSIPIQLARSEAEPLETRYLDFVYQPRREPDGTVSGIIALGVDVTENKRAAQLLLQSEKLNAVGRMASSIAHEINNPLEAVTNLIYLAQHSAGGQEIKEYLGIAELELKRVSAIANQTLRFHRQATSPRAVTVDDLIDSTLAIYQGRLNNSHVTVERKNRTGSPFTCFDGDIRQVLSNLVGNAIDSMRPDGGRLLIYSHERTHPRTGRREVSISVADTGAGMSAYTMSRVFEPFFTTKGASGTGLGLWISKEIVDRHRGTLTFRSRATGPRAGTVVTLRLPCE